MKTISYWKVMTPETWLLFHSSLRRKFNIHNVLILTLMGLILPINALNIPIDDLLMLSQFHCFNVNNICTSRLEYCNSFARECRPCSADICARKGSDDFPLQCSLNCSIAQARLAARKATNKVRELNETNSDLRALNTELNISVSELKIQNQELNATFQETKDSLETAEANLLLCKEEVDRGKDSSRWTINGLSGGLGCSFLIVLVLVVYRINKCRKDTIKKECCLTTDEEQCLKLEENSFGEQYCEGKLKGTCETNEDTQKTIATTQDKVYSLSRITRMNCDNSAVQADPATAITEDKNSDNTQSKLADDTHSKTEVDMSGLDSAPLKKAPSLHLKSFDMEKQLE